jgi:hypothetical protein
MGWTFCFGKCAVCGKFGILPSKAAKRCDNCKLLGYTAKKNPYKKNPEAT